MIRFLVIGLVSGAWGFCVPSAPFTPKHIVSPTIPTSTSAPASTLSSSTTSVFKLFSSSSSSSKYGMTLQAESGFQSSVSHEQNPLHALDELIRTSYQAPRNANEQSLTILFVGSKHASSLERIVQHATESMSLHNNNNVKFLAVVGGGVIGGGQELDGADKYSMSLMSGILPPGSNADIFHLDSESSPKELPSTIYDSRNSNSVPTSHLVFADPVAPIDQVLDALDSASGATVVAGGISFPEKMTEPSVAFQDQVLPAGSVVGVTFSGNVGIQAVVTQGCRSVGPPMVITSVAGNNVIKEINGKPAIDTLNEIAEHGTEEEKKLIRDFGALVGIHHNDNSQTDSTSTTDMEIPTSSSDNAFPVTDFLIRQILGFQPKSGSFVVNGKVQVGDALQFHVRAADSMKEDLQLMMQRAKTERLVLGAGGQLGTPIGAIQISSSQRGQSLFGEPNVDLTNIHCLLEETDNDSYGQPPIAGFFAKNEIGPVGIRMTRPRGGTTNPFDPKSSECNTYMHGYSTVVAMLCDYSKVAAQEQPEMLTVSSISSFEGAWD